MFKVVRNRIEVQSLSLDVSFPLSDDGIMDFLFGNPELKCGRALTTGQSSASPNIFKRLVQAHLESSITEDISLELETTSFNPQEEVDTTGFEENLLDYGDHADDRCDSSVQYEFPGEIRLQVVLLEDKLLMRRGKRRGWKWMSREEREKRSSKTTMDAWLDTFLTLDRFSLDGIQICTRSFRRLTDERLTDVCLRRLDNVHVYVHYVSDGVFKYSAALSSETRRVDLKEPELELFSAKLKDALLPSTITCLVVNAAQGGNIGPAVEIFKNCWSRVQVQSLGLGLTTNDDPQKCYDFIFAASPNSCSFNFVRVKDDEANPTYSYGQRRAPSQFFTDQRLRECLAHKITEIDFEETLPADGEGFSLGNDGIVEFLFGSPELKRKRALTGGYCSVSPNIFKCLVQAHLESAITEDISLDLEINSFDVREGMDTTGFDENLLDYGDDNRCDSSVQFEFPGEIRLQIVLLEDRMQMRRGKRRGWKWMSKEEREKQLEEHGDFDDWSDDEDVDDDEAGFFVGHDDYTD
ncbi:hypothetical protein AAVH_11292 [Aphelenchoides avenae]|nr:hypothetical protein AAVH_11292 [Aphelenchus avenae]